MSQVLQQESSMHSLDSEVNIPTSRTYTSDLITNFDDLDLEFETFNGSVTQLADKKPEIKPLVPVAINVTPEDTTFTEGDSHQDITSTGSMGSLVFDTTAESEVKPAGEENQQQEEINEEAQEVKTPTEEIQMLTVLKNRTKDYESIKLDEAQLAKIRRVSSQFTATKVTNGSQDAKVAEMSKAFDELSLKIHKIEKEIKFIDSILPSQPLSQMSLEFQKLSYGRSKLYDKCEALKKQRYEASIKLNHKLKKVYGENSDMTDFWIRGFN